MCRIPSTSITSSVSQDLKDPTDLKIIVYTNSKQQAIGPINQTMEGVLQKCKVNGDVIPMTGNDSVQFKVWVMHAFRNDLPGVDEMDMSDGDDGGNHPRLPNLRIMPATKLANCGVSIQLCRRSYRNGIPPSMYATSQDQQIETYPTVPFYLNCCIFIASNAYKPTSYL